MKTHPHPIRSTVIFGLLCGLIFIPLFLGLGLFVDWPQALFLPIWLFIVLYSSLLTRWSPAGSKSIIFPLVLILVALPWVDSITLFLILILGTLSWIRSGICFTINLGKQIIIEIFLCLLTGGLLKILNPYTFLTWAMAIWMFFLVQALYFVFFETRALSTASIKPGAFEYAREQAENILASQANI